MQMRDEDAPQVFHAEPRLGQARPESLLSVRGVHSCIDEAPPAVAFDQIRIDDRQAADGKGDWDAPDARRDEIAQRA
jgi:hypothetical protein